MNFKLFERKNHIERFFIIRDIYFLDDPLSSMDEKIGQEIFEDLIMTALAEKTILFVTHELEVHRFFLLKNI